MNEIKLRCVASSQRLSKKGTIYHMIGVALPDGSLVEMISFKNFAPGEDVTCIPVRRIIGNQIFVALAIKQDPNPLA